MFRLEKGDVIMGTVIVLVILAVIAALALKSIIKDRSNGKSPSCGCNCKDCHGCH
jgi:hypothetical protein